MTSRHKSSRTKREGESSDVTLLRLSRYELPGTDECLPAAVNAAGGAFREATSGEVAAQGLHPRTRPVQDCRVGFEDQSACICPVSAEAVLRDYANEDRRRISSSQRRQCRHQTK